MRRLAILIAFTTLTASTLAADVARKEIQHSIPSGNVARVTIDVPVGTLQIVNSRGPNVTVTGAIERDFHTGRGERKANEILAASDVELSLRGKSAVIRPRVNAGWGAGRANEYHLVVSVPRNVDLYIEQGVGELKMEGSFGNVDAALSVGDIEIRMPRSEVRELNAAASVGEVKSNLGDRVVTAEGFFAGSTHYLNERGHSTVRVRLRVGDAHIELTE